MSETLKCEIVVTVGEKEFSGYNPTTPVNEGNLFVFAQKVKTYIEQALGREPTRMHESVQLEHTRHTGLPNPLEISLGEGKISVRRYNDKDGNFGLVFTDTKSVHEIGAEIGEEEFDHKPQKGEIYLTFANQDSLAVVIEELDKLNTRHTGWVSVTDRLPDFPPPYLKSDFMPVTDGKSKTWACYDRELGQWELMNSPYDLAMGPITHFLEVTIPEKGKE